MAALAIGSRGDAVKQIQQELNALGAGLHVDGIWGEKTQNAYYSLGDKLSAQTNALVAGVGLGQGSRGDAVKYVQQQLNALGAGLNIDGVWGGKTQAAYASYNARLPEAVRSVIAGTASAPTVGAAGLAGLTYTPLSEQQFRQAAQAAYAPAYEAQKRTLAQQTQKSYADAILSAYGRGTQYSSYLGDTQASVLAAGARSQADLENTYQAQILDYVARQQADQQQIQLDLEKFNRQLMLEQQKLALAQKEAAAKREQLAYQIAQAKAR